MSHAHLLSQQAEVPLVGHEAEHDEVGVKAVQAVSKIVPPVGLRLARLANVIHDLLGMTHKM